MNIPSLVRPPKKTRWRGVFRAEWSILGETFIDEAENQLYDQGEQDVLEDYCRDTSTHTDFKIGLLKTAYAIDETHTMANIAAQELLNAQNGGYSARQVIARSAVGWPTSALAAGDWQITTAQVMWTATGAWADTAGYMFLMTGGVATPGNATGRITAVAALVPTRQLQAVNDNVKVTYALKLI